MQLWKLIMLRIREQVIDDFADFLAAEAKVLQQTNILYFAHIDAHALLSGPNIADKFLTNLDLCKNLSSITLLQCELQDQDLLIKHDNCSLISMLQKCTNLERICLRNNPLSQVAVDNFEMQLIATNTKLAVIFAGTKTCPPKFNLLQQGWDIFGPWTKSEYKDMIAVAETHASKDPQLLKLHAYRTRNQKKANCQIDMENLSSNLPLSALLINGRAFLLPKYASTPASVNSYNQNTTNHVYSFRKKISLVLHKDYLYSNTVDELKISLAKIYARALNISGTETSLEHEMYNLFRHGDHTLGLRRKYAKQNPTELFRKRYLIQEYIPGPDCFDAIEKSHYALNSQELKRSEIVLLDQTSKDENIRFCSAFALEAMSTHFMGLIHGDLKPDNWIQASPNNFKAIDFGLAMPHDLLQQYSKIVPRGSISYIAPEIFDAPDFKPMPANDAFSFGISIRQMLYPITFHSKSNGQLFFNDRVLFTNTAPVLEQALRNHFAIGIRENYGVAVTGIIYALTNPDPRSRMTVSHAFCELAVHCQQISQQVWNEKISVLKANIANILGMFNQANILVADNFPSWSNTPAVEMVSDRKQQNTALNHYGKLLTLNFFLQLYFTCNGELPEKAFAVLAKSVKELSVIQHKNCVGMSSIYYTNQDIEDVMRFHYKLSQTIFSIFSVGASELHAALEPDLQAILKLNNIQAEIRDKWLVHQPIHIVAEYILDQYNKLTKSLAANSIVLVTKVLQGLINDIETYTTQQHSPKSPRLSSI